MKPNPTPTETVSDKKIWGSVCCNVGVMCRGIGKDHRHICNKCGEKCEVRYDNPPTETVSEGGKYE